jgi:hypothetical protein
MSGTSKSLNMNSGTRKSFAAKYIGSCFNCRTGLFPGDLVFYPPNGENVMGVDCCGDLPDHELTTHTKSDDMPATEMDIPPGLVMPRGRTVQDRCPVCFMIPASNGLHGSSCDDR